MATQPCCQILLRSRRCPAVPCALPTPLTASPAREQTWALHMNTNPGSRALLSKVWAGITMCAMHRTLSQAGAGCLACSQPGQLGQAPAAADAPHHLLHHGYRGRSITLPLSGKFTAG